MKNKILITSPVHTSKEIFSEYLWSLNRLVIPDDTEIVKYFYLHNSEELSELLNDGEYKLITDDSFYECNERTHNWKDDNFSAVSEMRTMALNKAREEDFTHVFSVDSDLILNQNTLKLLIDDNKDIVSCLFFTNWNGDSYNVTPNAWDSDSMSYDSSTNGISRYKLQGLHKTGGTGACTLIKRNVFKNEYINYYKIPNVSFSKWEDRAFCIKAAIFGHEIYCDSRLLARHLYRESEYKQWMKDKEAMYG